MSTFFPTTCFFALGTVIHHQHHTESMNPTDCFQWILIHTEVLLQILGKINFFPRSTGIGFGIDPAVFHDDKQDQTP